MADLAAEHEHGTRRAEMFIIFPQQIYALCSVKSSSDCDVLTAACLEVSSFDW